MEKQRGPNEWESLAKKTTHNVYLLHVYHSIDAISIHSSYQRDFPIRHNTVLIVCMRACVSVSEANWTLKNTWNRLIEITIESAHALSSWNTSKPLKHKHRDK